MLPRSEDEFGEREYWERFYRARDDEPFEWYVPAKQCAELVANALPEEAGLVVNLGCGTCGWPQYFDKATVWSVDTSEEAVKRAVGNRHVVKLDDALELATVADGSASLVVDKGLIDALHARDDDSARASITRLAATVRRVLKPNGAFLVISLLEPHIRSLIEVTFDGVDVEPARVADSASSLVPFAVLVSGCGLRYRHRPVDTFRDLWDKVDADSKRRLVAVSLRLGGCGGDEDSLRRLRDRLAALDLPLLNWQDLPKLHDLAFGLKDIRATALLDADAVCPIDFRDEIALALDARDDDDDSDDDNPRVVVEILETHFGFAGRH
ncbi:hypothetical protein CTAYLR_000040 [Chrysophaeum taylorii]|uniref:Methyltransferase type 11 domain-containing protein n=1 Tax=Chrysophaeum taylorii TaxID=2483200 RepID=A0AAD7UIH8_9STRA|nr:hypothetical protein CTAYLR_000040 [Chrysophaeum taylorii]